MAAKKQLFGRTGNIAPQKHQETQLRVTDSGRIIFPSQEKIFGQLDHILGVFKDSEAEIRPHSHLEELKSCIPKIKLFTSYRKLFNKRPINKDVEGITCILRAQSEEMNIGIRLLNSAIHQHFMAVK